MRPSRDKLNSCCENETVIFGYKRSRLRTALTVLAVLLTGGFLFVLLAWKQSLRLKARFSPCPLREAEKVLLKDENQQEFVETVGKATIAGNKKHKITYFYNKKIKYVWNAEKENFSIVNGLNCQTTCAYFHVNSSGLESDVATARLEFYGLNSIVVEVKPILHLLRHEAVNPFYIFQLYTVILWTVQLYYYFALGIIMLSAISIFVTVLEMRKQSQLLHDAVHSESEVTVIRDKQEKRISSWNLVPGDVIVIPVRNYTLECDAVLVSGQCIVNESALTGESVPVTKLPAPIDSQEILQMTAHKRHVLFGGTNVLQTRSTTGEAVKAVVFRTGFSTTKGELVRSILFPKPLELKFYTDFLKFFVIFLLLGFGAVIYSAIMWSINQAPLAEVIMYSLDILTFVVPPVLPAAYTTVVAIAQRRLKKRGIYSLSSKYINMCGGLDVMCFDKTGTLTEDSLDLTAVVPVINSRFVTAIQDPTHLPQESPLLKTMATCHSLNLIDGQLTGYPLDLKIFDAIDWNLEDVSESVNQQKEKNCSPCIVSPRHQTSEQRLIILKQFPFESSAQRMSVICRHDRSTSYCVYVKGAPEMIVSLCRRQTVPEEFEDILLQYTKQGFRVIAACWKTLPEHLTWDEIANTTRDELEMNLDFLGLIILQNSLKPETIGVLRLLNEAEIRSIMVTGDNLLTAISVAYECELVQNSDNVILVEAKKSLIDTNKIEVFFRRSKADFERVADNGDCKVSLLEKSPHFAIDGKSFDLLRNYNRDLLTKIVHQGTIFARMLPEQKTQLVENLQELGHQVGMCGDGANDCGALKAAHAGVALCMAEASVAAPFTSKKPNISCIPKLIREGRASLVSCLGIFKFQVAYCFAQLFMVLILFYKAIKPTDPQYVYIDMILNIVPGLTFGYTGPYKHLVKEKPMKKLLAALPLISIFSFLTFQVVVYVITWEYCNAQTWFVPDQYEPGRMVNPPAHELTALFTVSIFSYLLAVVVFSQGPPFRKPIYTNVILMIFLLVSFIMNSVLTLYPGETLREWFSLKESPSFSYHLVLYFIALANCLFCYFWEKYVICGLLALRWLPVIQQRLGPFEPYEVLQRKLDKDKNWPPSDTCMEIDATLPCTGGGENFVGRCNTPEKQNIQL